MHDTGEPLDIILSYCHLNLQNDALTKYVQQFQDRAQVKQLVAASPLNMGLLTPRGPPAWHPSSPELRQCALKANDICAAKGWKLGLPDLALGFAYRKAKELDLPTVVGLSTPEEVHETFRVWREVNSEEEQVSKRLAVETAVVDEFRAHRCLGRSWPSPPESFEYSRAE